MLDIIQYGLGLLSIASFGVSQWGWKKNRDSNFANDEMLPTYQKAFPIGAVLGTLSAFAAIAIQAAK